MQTKEERRARHREQAKKRYLADPQKFLAQNRLYYAKNRDRMKAAFEKRKRDNPERYDGYAKKFYLKNRERIIGYTAKWRKNNPEKNKRAYTNSRLKKKYGLTIEQYKEMARKQNYNCLACGIYKPGSGKDGLHLDHCHSTGKLRGMLCNRCNLGLGIVEENIERMEGLLTYLKAHK